MSHRIRNACLGWITPTRHIIVVLTRSVLSPQLSGVLVADRLSRKGSNHRAECLASARLWRTLESRVYTLHVIFGPGFLELSAKGKWYWCMFKIAPCQLHFFAQVIPFKLLGKGYDFLNPVTMGNREEENFQSLWLFSQALRLETIAGQWGVYVCCAHAEYEKPGAIKWEWWRGTSTR